VVDAADFDCFGPNQQESATYSGYTRFTPSSDSRIIYVSSSGGNDANSGLSPSAPLRTIGAGYALLRQGFPDWLLLKRGDTFEGNVFWNQSGRSPLQPAIFGSYGIAGAARPTILSGDGAAWGKWVVSSAPRETNYVALVGIHFESNSFQNNTETLGIWWIGAGSNFLIEDCFVRGFSGNITLQDDANNITSLRDITVRRNIVVDAHARPGSGHSQGMFVHYLDGLLIEDNIFDHNGYKEGVTQPTWFNHNMYITSYNDNVVVRNNVVTRASSHGIQLRSGGVVENNLFARDPLAIFVAYRPTDVVDNVIIEGTDILSTPPLARAHAIETVQSVDVHIERNVIANKLSTSSYTGSAVSITYGNPNELVLPTTYRVAVGSNIVSNWCNNNRSGAAIDLDNPAGFTAVTITGNLVQQNCSDGQIAYSRSATTDPAKVTFSDNIYYSTRDPNRWFGAAGFDFSYATWRTQYYPDNSQVTPIVFTDPNRNLASYNQSIGGTASFEAFMADAKAASRQNWSKYSASTVNDYIRAGFR